MTALAPGPRLSDDARFELAMTAAARERRNRPRLLLVIALGLLGAAFLTALAALFARSRAESELRSAQANTTVVEGWVREYRDLQGRQDTNADLFSPEPLLMTRLEELALTPEVGMQQAPQQPRTTQPNTVGPLVEYNYLYPSVRDPSLGSLLRWLAAAEREIPGLEIYNLNSLKPDPSGDWIMSVTFRRWERRS